MNALLKPARPASPWLFPLFTALILAYSFFLIQLSASRQIPELVSLAMLCDLVLGIPLLYYFWVARPLKLPAVTSLGVLLLTVLTALWIVPSEQQRWLQLAEWGLVLLEGAVLLYGLSKLNQIRQVWRQNPMPGLLERLEFSLTEVMGHSLLVRIMASELSTIAYALLPGRILNQVEDHGERRAFSYHQRSIYGVFVGGVLMLSVVELFGMHVLIGHWSPGLAWIFSGLSAYGSLIMIAEIRTVKRRLHLLEGNTLVLRRGVFWRARVPLSQIASFESVVGELPKARDLVNFGLMQPRWLLTLKEPLLVEGVYGIRRKPLRLALELDDPEAFRQVLSLLTQTE